MTNQELLAYNKNRIINQVCVVTDDLERTMKAWVDIFKIGPWQVMINNNKTLKNLVVNGKPVVEEFEYKVACTNIGDMQIELIQPLYGPTIYQEYLDRKGPGLHHIKEKITDEEKLKATVEHYKSKGFGVMQTGYFFEDVHYYMDTEKAADVIFELGNCPPLDLPQGSYTMYPPEE